MTTEPPQILDNLPERVEIVSCKNSAPSDSRSIALRTNLSRRKEQQRYRQTDIAS